MFKFIYNGVEMAHSEVEQLMREEKIALTPDGENFIVRMITEEERFALNKETLKRMEMDKIRLEMEIEYLERKLNAEPFRAFSSTPDIRSLVLEDLKSELAKKNN
ncbi:MAG: hypothetical protein FWE36_04775 [Erysipelotrichales bacterium]|nr:hypothetical protein [Erysipelotrichales bacterium]